VQDAGVTGAAGAGVGEDDDIPPPQALKAAISKAHVAAGNIARSERCIEISSLVLVLSMSAGSFRYGYAQKRREAATNPVKFAGRPKRGRSITAVRLRDDGRKQIDDENDEQHDAVQNDGSPGSQGNSRDEQRQDQQHS
jgi:hypothetical protein